MLSKTQLRPSRGDPHISSKTPSNSTEIPSADFLPPDLHRISEERVHGVSKLQEMIFTKIPRKTGYSIGRSSLAPPQYSNDGWKLSTVFTSMEKAFVWFSFCVQFVWIACNLCELRAICVNCVQFVCIACNLWELRAIFKIWVSDEIWLLNVLAIVRHL